MKKNLITCEICKQKYPKEELFHLEMVRDSVLKLIKREKPKINTEGYICIVDLEQYQLLRNQEILKDEIGELNNLEEEILNSIKTKELISGNINEEFEEKLTFGQKVADDISYFGGSWKFIILFLVVLISWIIINSIIFFTKAFDPYPFILLNLVLSCLAAIQAPIIMMSQNRQAAKDRIMTDHDYKINLKAEIQVRQLNSKIDHLMKRQGHSIVELEQMQFEINQSMLELRKLIAEKK